MKYLLIVLAATALFAADRSGPFLEAGMGVSRYQDDGRLAERKDAAVPQYRVGAGAFINKYLSVALDYGHFGTFDGKSDAGENVVQTFRVLSADVAAHYPLFDERIDLFGRFGAGELFWEQRRPGSKSSSAGTVLFGAGIGVRVKPWLTINSGYDLYSFRMEEDATVYKMRLGSAYLSMQVQF